jgi:hypothetical protein
MNEILSEGPMRMKATDVLRDRAKALRHKADGLQQLADTLDLIERNGGESSPHISVGSPAEEALWDIACGIR